MTQEPLPPASSAPPSSSSPRLSSHARILVGFVTGVVAGGLGHLLLGPEHAGLLRAVEVAEPVGKLFLRALLVCVIPLVVSSLVLGVTGLGDLKKLGRIGSKTLLMTLVLSSISVCVGLAAANLIEPGAHLDEDTRQALIARHSQKAVDVTDKAKKADRPLSESIVEVIPDNVVGAMAKSPPDMLGLMLFCLFFGTALALQKEEVKKPVVDVAAGVFAASSTMVGLLMKAAPVGVACLLFAMTSRFGFGVLVTLGWYVGCVIGALLFHQLVVYGLALKLFGGMSPIEFLKRAQPALLTAFSTSSSNATLPTALEVTQTRLGVPAPIASFVLTVGATANQNGTALFEGVTVLFLAQVFGVELTIAQQLMLLVMAVVAGVGTAGVPAASLPFIAIVLAQVGVPPEALAIILGVDRLLDMCRTVVNVSGDMAVAVVIAHSERTSTAATAAPSP